jgi:hypothetical protein
MLGVVLLAVSVIASAYAVGSARGSVLQRDRLQPLVDSAAAESERLRSDLKTQTEATRSAQDRLDRLEQRVESSVGDLEHPHFVLWNSCDAGVKKGCVLTPSRFYVGSVPDTFTYHISYRATVPVTVMIMSASDYACWYTHLCAAHWVGWTDRRSLANEVFHAAEGCAAYVAVFKSSQSGTLYPSIEVTRNPAPRPTGVCR